MIYISGPITGTTDYYQRFKKAETDLLKIGYVPINPIENETVGMSWTYYMKSDIKKLMFCDKIYMLKGWRRSRGALLEWFLAVVLKYEVIYERKKT